MSLVCMDVVLLSIVIKGVSDIALFPTKEENYLLQNTRERCQICQTERKKERRI